MILGGENIAGNPADFGTEIGERLDENRRLDRHVQRSHDAHALQRLGLAILFPCRHQAGHLVLGNVDFLTSEIGEADVPYFVVCKTHIIIC